LFLGLKVIVFLLEKEGETDLYDIEIVGSDSREEFSIIFTLMEAFLSMHS